MSIKFLNRAENNILALLGVQSSSLVIRLNGGRNSIAYRVENNVFRFPKNETVWIQQQQEALLLSFLRQKLSCKWQNKIPDITCHIQKGYPFAQHTFITGKTCNQGGDQSIFYDDLSSANQIKLATELADFLVALHQISTFQNLPVAPNEWITPVKSDFNFDSARECLFKMTDKKIDLTEFQTTISLKNIALIHND